MRRITSAAPWEAADRPESEQSKFPPVLLSGLPPDRGLWQLCLLPIWMAQRLQLTPGPHAPLAAQQGLCPKQTLVPGTPRRDHPDLPSKAELQPLTPPTHTSMGSLLALGAPPPLLARQRSHAAASCSALTVPGPPGRRPGRAGRGAAASACRARGAAARGRTLRVCATYSPYPWQERDYYRVALQMVQVGAGAGRRTCASHRLAWGLSPAAHQQPSPLAPATDGGPAGRGHAAGLLPADEGDGRLRGHC